MVNCPRTGTFLLLRATDIVTTRACVLSRTFRCVTPRKMPFEAAKWIKRTAVFCDVNRVTFR